MSQNIYIIHGAFTSFDVDTSNEKYRFHLETDSIILRWPMETFWYERSLNGTDDNREILPLLKNKFEISRPPPVSHFISAIYIYIFTLYVNIFHHCNIFHIRSYVAYGSYILRIYVTKMLPLYLLWLECTEPWLILLLRVNEAKEVPICSHIWFASMTFKQL